MTQIDAEHVGEWEEGRVEIRDLEAFVAVAEELHFGRAAARLHISQPPLSNRIRLLEADLGVQLFQRSTRSVTLTQAGARLLKPAQHALTQLLLTQRIAMSIKSGEQGLVRIGFAGASSQRALPALSRAVREEYPGIELQLQSQTYVYTALEMLSSGELDLAFVRLPIHDPELSARIVEIETIVCAIPEGHPLASLDEIELATLYDEDFVSLPDNQGSILQATMISLCIAAGFRPRVTQVAPDSATVLALVAAGVGVTITLSSTAPVQQAGVVYRKLVDIHPSHMFAAIAWRKSDPSPSLMRVLQVSETALPTPDLSLFENNPFTNGIELE